MRPVLATVILVLGCLETSGCGRRQPPPEQRTEPRYTLGAPWQSDGYWFYPAEQLAYQAAGLAVVDAPEPGTTRRTADGETYDPERLAASHQTLQLPVVLRVRNLENGREILLRVNDRGPASPGRLLSVTPHAARLLGMVPGRATRVRLEEDQRLSQDLLDQVVDAPKPDVIAAPVGVVQEQSLMNRSQAEIADSRLSLMTIPAQQHPLPQGFPTRPVEAVTMEPVEPGQLWIDAGHFMQPIYARRLAAELAGTVRQEGHGRSAVFLVRVGPFNLPAEADAALDHARAAGVTGARIIVE